MSPFRHCFRRTRKIHLQTAGPSPMIPLPSKAKKDANINKRNVHCREVLVQQRCAGSLTSVAVLVKNNRKMNDDDDGLSLGLEGGRSHPTYGRFSSRAVKNEPVDVHTNFCLTAVRCTTDLLPKSKTQNLGRTSSKCVHTTLVSCPSPWVAL